jgi:hypothetical protein
MQQKMQVFHHRNLQSILGVNTSMLLVETYSKCCITHKTIQLLCCNTPCVVNNATKRQLNWIGKVAGEEMVKLLAGMPEEQNTATTSYVLDK